MSFAVPRPRSDVHRFRWAALIGMAATFIPYCWVLFDLWGNSPSLLRTARQDGFASNFYDLQARAMFAGHLFVAKGSLGIEAYIHDGREYTYFGIFPSLLRMPVLLVTHAFDGRLTALSLLVAYLLTGLFTSMLLWRTRIMVRGTVRLGMTEAVALAIVIASIMGGSTLVFLAASPNAYAEDLAWSVATTVGSLFALLGVLERPSVPRIIASGVLILAASLNRLPTGYACVIAAVLTAGWFALGRGGSSNRKWWLPILTAGLIPLVIACLVNVAKLGTPFGLPITEGVAFKVLGGPNGGHEFSVRFLPSTLFAYFRPEGLRFTTSFPFITMPATIATGIWHVSVYGNRAASVTASMPLLFLLSVWGVIIAFRPRVDRGVKMTRIVLVGAALCGGGVLVFGWLYNRYLADFLPVLVVGSAVGLIDVWRRLEHRSRSSQGFAVLALGSLGVFSIAANLGIAVTPSDTWSKVQVLHYVQAQRSIGALTGQQVSADRGYQLPNWAPADRLFVIGHCADLYISDGEGPPGKGALGFGWLLVQQGPRRSLCRELISDPRMSEKQMPALIRSDRALMQVQSAVVDWTFVRAALGKGGSTSKLARPTVALIDALRHYNSAVGDLRLNDGAASAARATVGADWTMQRDLITITPSSQPLAPGWTTKVNSDWQNLMSAATSLLAMT